jgi:hypothetical protein
MSKQTNTPAKVQGTNATTASERVELSIRDYIRVLKKNVKAIRTLEGIGANKPGIKQAIEALVAENEIVKNSALHSVAKQIELALKEE